MTSLAVLGSDGPSAADLVGLVQPEPRHTKAIMQTLSNFCFIRRG